MPNTRIRCKVISYAFRENYDSCYGRSGRAGALTMHNDIVVSRTTVGLTLAGMLASLLLVGGVIVCAVRGFVCLVFG